MMEVFGYAVLGIILLAVIGAFIKVLSYALDTLSKNDD